MINTNIGIEWGLDARVNDAGDIEFILNALKLDDDGSTVLFSKRIAAATMQAIVTNADSMTAQQKNLIINALNNFRDNLAGTL